MKGNLKAYEKIEENVSLTCLSSQNEKEKINKNLLQSSVIVESLHQNKKTIYVDRLHTCEDNSQQQKSSKILDQDLISNEKELKPFWNDTCKEIASHLSLPIEIDCVDSDLNYLTFLQSQMVEKSWFSTKMNFRQNKNCQQILSQFCTYFPVECMAYESIKTKSLRIYPTKEQKIILKQWFGVSRKIYNETINKLNKHDGQKSWMSEKTFQNHNSETWQQDWCKKVPFQIRGNSIKEAYTNFYSNCKKSKKKGKPFEMKFKSRKNLKQTVTIPAESLKKDGVYPRILGFLDIKERNKYYDIIKNNPCDSKLTYDHGNYYIIVNYKVLINPNNNHIENQDVVAIDPGVRNFATIYSLEGVCGYIGRKSFQKIYKLSLLQDKIISLKSKINKISYRRKLNRIYQRRKSLIDELHWKTIQFLIQNFDYIIFPHYETQDLVQKMVSDKKKKKFMSQSVRSMLSFNNYLFKQRLKQKCKEYGNVYIEVSEAYTSKTHPVTGELMNIGNKETFKYNKLIMSRDINGARNIMLRTLRDASVTIGSDCYDLPTIKVVGANI